mmetsp:Transcript_1795/g.2551  ORF Transcript_1795/g.2551 Transcript_1795/m.2551 type:complete len:270 (-) Transcript_1795:248-1057(-)|eukprot:CAMPEP_0170462992 /NCGR_PEP_ID=MMETSP0123-20130129/8273_1 /TAXON_ID=182087 /ORGANISM="Favella ehrenbergii, Strain Fehren 1" /LENGTH=269 /DNA_ID=CAMNT_0010728317 /DNA_START=739 /DNA_END=1548 /DNA_ORIENTATION=-
MVKPDFFWGFYSEGIAIGTVENSFGFEVVPDMDGAVYDGNKFYSIIDTGSTALVISVLYFEPLIENLFAYAGIDDWKFDSGIVLTKCKYELPSLFFDIDGKWVEARPQDYMYDFEGNGRNCMLFIMPASSGMNILGMPLHVDYYSVHDPEKGTVSWAPHKDSPKGTIKTGPPPTGKRLLRSSSTEVKKRLSPVITLIVVIFMAVLSAITWEKWFIPWIDKRKPSTRMRKIYSASFFVFMMLFTVYAMFPVVRAIVDTDEDEGSGKISTA